MTFTPPYFLRIFSNSVYLMSMQSVPECMSSSSSCLHGLYSQCLPAISVVRFSCLHGLYCRCSPATVSLLSPTCLHDLYSRCSPATVSLLSASANAWSLQYITVNVRQLSLLFCRPPQLVSGQYLWRTTFVTGLSSLLETPRNQPENY